MSGHDLWVLGLGLGAGLISGFLNTAAAAGSAVCFAILLLIGLDPITANATNRIPVLLGALAGTATFHAQKTMPWDIAIKVSIPTTIGSLFGALLAEVVPAGDLRLMITAAVLIALLLLFGKLRQAIERAAAPELRYGRREMALLFGIGAWTGFIVLDGATYLLLSLVLVVGLSLAQANAVKAFVAVTTAIVPMAIFMYKGSINWKVGMAAGVGSVLGGYLGARFASSPRAKQYVFYLLVTVLSAELVNLLMHYILKTHR
ncbi:MAG TPA: sulfite exporter TauE/SafE family protein [Reyranella sp.]|nr:sulfite exporter TauE/SafE family protein [Reyranella sp.]